MELMPLQLKIIKWYVYYSHDVLVGKTIEEWRKAANEDVQCVSLFYEGGKSEVITNKELYMMYDGKHGLTFLGTSEKPHPMQELCEINEIKIGKLIEAHNHYDIVKRAQEDAYGN